MKTFTLFLSVCILSGLANPTYSLNGAASTTKAFWNNHPILIAGIPATAAIITFGPSLMHKLKDEINYSERIFYHLCKHPECIEQINKESKAKEEYQKKTENDKISLIIRSLLKIDTMGFLPFISWLYTYSNSTLFPSIKQ